MAAVWDKARYERYYRDAPEGTLAYTCARFAKQAQALIDGYGLTPADGLVIVGDAWGGLATAFVDLGWSKDNIELTEASQYIFDNWHLYGSPHVTRPALTTSYDEADRLYVRAQARGSEVTNVWCLVADCAGDDADVSRFEGFNHPDTGYCLGSGRVVHLITPLAHWEEANQEPDNVWQTIEDWEAAFQALPRPQEVISLHGASKASRSDKTKAQADPPIPSPYEAEFPYSIRIGVGSGPNVTSTGTYILAIDGSDYLIMTKWDEATGAYVQVGTGGPTSSTPAGVYTNVLQDGDLLHVSWCIGGSDSRFISYDTSTDTWGTEVQIYQSLTTRSNMAPVAKRNNGWFYAVAPFDPERIMGTDYYPLAVFRSISGGDTWHLWEVIGEGEQQSGEWPAIIAGNNDAMHICFREWVANNEIVITLPANEVLGPPRVAGDVGERAKCAGAITSNGVVCFVYRRNAGGLWSIQFVSSDDPTQFATAEVNSVSMDFHLGFVERIGQFFVIFSNSVATYITYDQGTGQWLGAATVEQVAFHKTAAVRGTGIGYVSGDPTYKEIALPLPVGFTVLTQQTLANPPDYQPSDAGEWMLMPYKPEPKSGQTGGQDDVPGYVMCVNIQGVCYEADHYHVGTVYDDTRQVWCAVVTMWNNDPDDWTPEEMWAEVWTMHPLLPDDQFGGQYNTVQSVVVYCAPGSFEWNRDPAQNREVRDAAEFVPPKYDIRHGIWVTNESYEAHQNARTPYDWKSWMSDLPQADQGHARRLPFWREPAKFR